MQKRKLENGRTLIEMIGVVALIGLLTIGGLSLFGDATTRLRMNDILEEVRKQAALVKQNGSKIENRAAGDLMEKVKPVTKYGYGIGRDRTTMKIASGSVTVLVGQIKHDNQAISQRLCKTLVKQIKPTSKCDGKDEPRCAVRGDVINVCKGGNTCKSCEETVNCETDDFEKLCIKIKM